MSYKYMRKKREKRKRAANKKKPMSYMISKFVPTDEDWIPSFLPGVGDARGESWINPLSVIAVRIALFSRGSDWFISVWGQDDIGFEKQFPEFAEAKTFYDSMETPSDVLKDRLLGIGFQGF